MAKTNGAINSAPGYVDPLGLLVHFMKVDPIEKKMLFRIQQQTNHADDYVVLKAIHKPWINLLWLGTFILVAGFLTAIYRRVSENKA